MVQGVSATPRGALVVEKAGFQERDIIHIKRLAIHKQQGRENPPDAADVSLWYVAIISKWHVRKSLITSSR